MRIFPTLPLKACLKIVKTLGNTRFGADISACYSWPTHIVCREWSVFPAYGKDEGSPSWAALSWDQDQSLQLGMSGTQLTRYYSNDTNRSSNERWRWWRLTMTIMMMLLLQSTDLKIISHRAQKRMWVENIKSHKPYTPIKWSHWITLWMAHWKKNTPTSVGINNAPLLTWKHDLSQTKFIAEWFEIHHSCCVNSCAI